MPTAIYAVPLKGPHIASGHASVFAYGLPATRQGAVGCNAENMLHIKFGNKGINNILAMARFISVSINFTALLL